MKKISLALFALAAALAITPAVMADSFEYTINGTNFNAALNLVTGPANIANGATQAGAYTILDVSGTFSVNGGPAITFGPTAPEVANTGSNAPKQPQVQAAAATTTPPPAQKGFKRQGRKQQPQQPQQH